MMTRQSARPPRLLVLLALTLETAPFLPPLNDSPHRQLAALQPRPIFRRLFPVDVLPWHLLPGLIRTGI
jgi:hypothetical protein